MTDTYSESWRAECEARYVAKLGSKASDYLAKVEAKRGKEAAERLRSAAREEYRKGQK